MQEINGTRVTLFVTSGLAALMLFCGVAIAQSTQVQGVIDGRKPSQLRLIEGGPRVVDLSQATVVPTCCSK
jgi:hypothetical protein